MMLEDVFIHQISKYEISKYAEAFKEVKAIERERDEAIQDMYEDISPVMTYIYEDIGVIGQRSVSVEDKAIEIIEMKEAYAMALERHKRDAEIFELSMQGLSPREKDVIRVAYFGKRNDLNLSPVYFQEVLAEAEEKIGRYIKSHKHAADQAKKLEHKRLIKEQIVSRKKWR